MGGGPQGGGVLGRPPGDVDGVDVGADELREMLDGFATSQRGIVVARARGGSLPT